MVIDIKEDVVRLSGSLSGNHWPAIQSAAYMVSRWHPQWVIVDCAHLEPISPRGALTFLDAIRHIAVEEPPFILTALPEKVLAMLERHVRGRRELPIAESVETARLAPHGLRVPAPW
jgi:hypothetical protein